jgi:hypothetical protein
LTWIPDAAGSPGRLEERGTSEFASNARQSVEDALKDAHLKVSASLTAASTALLWTWGFDTPHGVLYREIKAGIPLACPHKIFERPTSSTTLKQVR